MISYRRNVSAWNSTKEEWPAAVAANANNHASLEHTACGQFLQCYNSLMPQPTRLSTNVAQVSRQRLAIDQTFASSSENQRWARQYLQGSPRIVIGQLLHRTFHFASAVPHLPRQRARQSIALQSRWQLIHITPSAT